MLIEEGGDALRVRSHGRATLAQLGLGRGERQESSAHRTGDPAIIGDINRFGIGSLYSDRPPEWGGGGRRRRQPGVMVQSLLARGPIGSQPSRLSPRLSRPARERRGFDRKGSRVRTSIRATSRSCSETATPAEGGAAMRYYIGVDWADAEHAVWVADEEGQRVSATMVPHSAVGCSEWGRQLDEWRAQGIGLWAAIERPEGRVVDFLLDHGVMV